MARKKILLAVFSVAGLIFLLIWIQGGFHSKVPGGRSSGKESKAPVINTIEVTKTRTAETVTVSGTVISRDTARVASRIQGYVVELNVDAGDHVKKGQVLLKIDTKEFAERLEQAKANLESAKADLIKARNDFERYKVLYEKESIAKKDYDDALAKYEVTKAAESRAQAALEEARTMMSYGVVTAPFDGIVAERSISVGDLATPGKPLMSIYVPGTLELVAPVGEQYAPFLKVGSPVELTVPSIGLKQKSKIREIVPQRDERTRTITVKAPLLETPGLSPGLYGIMSFETELAEIIALPASAVKVVGQLETVRVVENGVVSIRHIKTGRTLPDGRIEIISGLNPGDHVVDQ